MSRHIGTPVKGSLDKRDYRVIELENGLRATLVSDPTTDKSAAALSVGVGHFCDPIGAPGLAHYLEHVCSAFQVNRPVSP